MYLFKFKIGLPLKTASFIKAFLSSINHEVSQCLLNFYIEPFLYRFVIYLCCSNACAFIYIILFNCTLYHHSPHIMLGYLEKYNTIYFKNKMREIIFNLNKSSLQCRLYILMYSLCRNTQNILQ